MLVEWVDKLNSTIHAIYKTILDYNIPADCGKIYTMQIIIKRELEWLY